VPSGGYTASHAKFNDDNAFWFRKASSPIVKKAKTMEKVVALKVHMVTHMPGRKNYQLVGVSIYEAMR